MVTKGDSVGRDKLRVWDIYTTTYKIDNQQRPTVQHRELQSTIFNDTQSTQYFVITCKGKESEREYIYN